MKQVFKGATAFFVIKSGSIQNIKTSIEEAVWATTYKPNEKLVVAFRKFTNVIMLFAHNDSRAILGIARMDGEPEQDLKPHIF